MDAKRTEWSRDLISRICRMAAFALIITLVALFCYNLGAARADERYSQECDRRGGIAVIVKPGDGPVPVHGKGMAPVQATGGDLRYCIDYNGRDV